MGGGVGDVTRCNQGAEGGECSGPSDGDGGRSTLTEGEPYQDSSQSPMLSIAPATPTTKYVSMGRVEGFG